MPGSRKSHSRVWVCRPGQRMLTEMSWADSLVTTGRWVSWRQVQPGLATRNLSFHWGMVVECHGMVTSMLQVGKWMLTWDREATGLAEDRHLSGRSRSSHSPRCRHSDIHSHGGQIWWVLGAAVMYGTPLDLVDGVSAFLGTLMGMIGQQCGEVIQTRSEYVSSEESDSHSRQCRKSHHRHASSRRILRMRRSSSRWLKPSPSSSSSRSPSAGSSGRRRHRSPPLPKPQVFAGKKGEWNGFIFQFRKTARYFGWSQREKGDRLLASLRGKAVDFIMSKPREVQDDYQALKDVLEVRFGKMEHPTSARRQLGYLRQEEGENLEDYADKVLTKVSEAYPGIDDEMEQDLAKEAFLRGCHHRSAAYATAEKDPVTLQEALEEVQNSAVNLKALVGAVLRHAGWALPDRKMRMKRSTLRSMRKSSGTCSPGSWGSMSKVRVTEIQTEPSNAIRCYRWGGRGHMSRECRKEGRRCFACREVGHMHADCPGKRGVQSSSRGRGKKGHLNWKGADTQAIRPPLRMFSKSARKFTWTKVKSAVISRRQGQSQVRTRKWGACQQKTLQRTGSWSSYWVRRSAWWFTQMKSRSRKMLNLQAIQRHRQIVVAPGVVVLRYVNLTGHRTRRWQWWYQCGLGAGKWWLWWTQQRRSLSWALRWTRNLVVRRLWKRCNYGMRSRTPGCMEAYMNTLFSSWVVRNTTGMLWRLTLETPLSSALTSWSRWNARSTWMATTWNWPMETVYQPPWRETLTVMQYMWVECCCTGRLQYHRRAWSWWGQR